MSDIKHRQLFAGDDYVADLNARVAAGRPGCDDAAIVALMIILDEDIMQVISIESTPVTLLRCPKNKRMAILVNDENDVRFTNDPWYWDGLTYKERPS